MDSSVQNQSIQNPRSETPDPDYEINTSNNKSTDSFLQSLMDTPPSSNPSSPSDERDQLIFTPPRSPYLHSRTPDRMDITPSSPIVGPNVDEFVMLSDSDGASQSSLDLGSTPKVSTRHKLFSSDEEDQEVEGRARYYGEQGREGLAPPLLKPPPRRKRPSVEQQRKRSPTTTSGDPTSTPKTTKKKIRRQSKEPSERSRSDFIPGTGYTSVPATGKVFRNLLILEESLREQVIQQRAMRRKYLTFLALLCSIIASLIHHLFILDASMSSTGTTRVILQFLLLATIITLTLYHLSGEYQKTIVLPRKFLSSTNKGLRQLNVRLVKIKTPLIDKITDLIREISLYIVTINLDMFHKISPFSIQNPNSKIEVFLVSCQSQCQPRIGVTDVKLVLNARVFNVDIREGWELYRSEFWINEGVRRRNNMMAFTKLNEKSSERKSVSSGSASVAVKRKKRKSSANADSVLSVPQTLSEENLKKLDKQA
ncbi:Sporulation-specific protein SPO7 [Spathaspora sp. JA1]|nr:Sporulation-specific protein SPO7 [Spathaspora sp. JA1]